MLSSLREDARLQFKCSPAVTGFSCEETTDLIFMELVAMTLVLPCATHCAK